MSKEFIIRRGDCDEKSMLVGKISYSQEVKIETWKSPQYMYRCFDPNGEDQKIDNSNLIQLKKEEKSLRLSRKPTEIRSDREKELTKKINTYKNKSLAIEDSKGNGFVGKQTQMTSPYVLLFKIGNDFKVFPVESWINFNKKMKFQQQTIEEVEQKIKNSEKLPPIIKALLERENQITDNQSKTSLKAGDLRSEAEVEIENEYNDGKVKKEKESYYKMGEDGSESEGGEGEEDNPKEKKSLDYYLKKLLNEDEEEKNDDEEEDEEGLNEVKRDKNTTSTPIKTETQTIPSPSTNQPVYANEEKKRKVEGKSSSSTKKVKQEKLEMNRENVIRLLKRSSTVNELISKFNFVGDETKKIFAQIIKEVSDYDKETKKLSLKPSFR